MKTCPVCFVFVLLFFSCSVKPEPLVMGVDACYTCKMTLVDEKFGAEIVTRKGKLYKFDDLNCMIDFIHSGHEPGENISVYMVADYSNAGKLVDATQSFYCQSDLVKSPMAGNVAAFARSDDLKKFNAGWQGTILTWDALIRRLPEHDSMPERASKEQHEK